MVAYSESKPRFEEWVNKRGNWDKTVKHDMQCAINHYLGQKVVKNIAVYGFCWGGLMAIRSAQDSSLPVKAGGLVHPARWTMDDAQTVKKPLVIMPSMNENDMVNYKLRNFSRFTPHNNYLGAILRNC